MAEGEQLTGGIEYATELFLPATAKRMARHLEVGPDGPAFVLPYAREPSARICTQTAGYQHALPGGMASNKLCAAAGAAGKHRSRTKLRAGGAEHHAS